MNLKELKKEIPFKWRVQSFSKFKPQAQCVAYIDARQAMNLLDEVLGEGGWQSDYKEIKGNVYAGIGIKISDEWVWKWDTGAESNIEKEKGEASDSFKRAGVKWGIGRFLYEKKIQYVNANEIKTQSNYPYVVDNSGKRVWDITKHINQEDAKVHQGNQSYQPLPNQSPLVDNVNNVVQKMTNYQKPAQANADDENKAWLDDATFEDAIKKSLDAGIIKVGTPAPAVMAILRKKYKVAKKWEPLVDAEINKQAIGVEEIDVSQIPM